MFQAWRACAFDQLLSGCRPFTLIWGNIFRLYFHLRHKSGWARQVIGKEMTGNRHPLGIGLVVSKGICIMNAMNRDWSRSPMELRLQSKVTPPLFLPAIGRRVSTAVLGSPKCNQTLILIRVCFESPNLFFCASVLISGVSTVFFPGTHQSWTWPPWYLV